MIMKNITYRELLDQLKAFRDNDLDLNVTVFVRGVDEYYPVKGVEKTDCDDVLFEGHPFLVV
jgi:hypothetical protein